MVVRLGQRGLTRLQQHRIKLVTKTEQLYVAVMTKNLFSCVLAVVCCLVISSPGRAQGNVRKDKFAFASPSGNVLQCTCSVGGDGALHANNRQINREETWWLWTVGDPKNHQVALQNYNNSYFFWRISSFNGNHRARMIHDLTGEATWTIISGEGYGLPAGYVAFRAYDGSYLKAWQGGGHANAPGETGEVFVDHDGPTKDIQRVGWWHMGQVQGDPPPGKDIFDGGFAALKWIGNAIAYPFLNGNTTPENHVTSAPEIACTALPPPVVTGTAQYLHAYCEDAKPSAYLGPYYSQNEPYVTRRVLCDIDDFHKKQPLPSCVVLNCSIGGPKTPGCANVP